MPVRILIADDYLPMRSHLKKILETHSNRWKVCAEAANGAEAVQKAIACKPDLIILDFQMPVMNGLSASVRISKALPQVPMLLCTVHESNYLDWEARKAGVRGVISKSDPEALLSAVSALLARISHQD
jgi:DNA-binding NarL/FixJ family response regulator